MKKKFELIYIIVFFIILIIPLTSMLTGIEASNHENRRLSVMPDILVNNRINTGFPLEFETYFSENFGLRPLFISAYGALNYYLLNHSVNDQVIKGKEGQLFFSKTLPDYTGENAMTPFEIDKLYKVIEIQKQWLEHLGTEFIFMPVPNKNTVYPQYMPARYKKSQDKHNINLLNDLFENSDIKYVNLTELFSGWDECLYQKTDTHWNDYGATIAYNEMIRLFKGVANNYEAHFDYEKGRTGDLANMLMPAFGIKEIKPVVKTNNNYRYIKPIRSFDDMKIETECDCNESTVLMFRDSFANSLIPVISDNFGYCLYSRGVPPDYRLVNEQKFDLVVLEIVERNLRDLLCNVPIMPALPVDIKIEEQRSDADSEITINVSDEYGLTKITGLISGVLTNEIYVHTGGNLYQAFPIVDNQNEFDTDEQLSSVFSIYLENDMSIGGNIQILYRSPSGNFINSNFVLFRY